MTDDYAFNQEENTLSENELSGAEDGKVTLPHTIQLEWPVQWTKDKVISEITFKNRLTAEAVEHLPVDNAKHQLGHFYPLIAKMIGQPLGFVRKMDHADLTSAFVLVTHFLLKTGG